MPGAILAADGADEHAGDDTGGAHLVLVDVAAVLDDNFVAGAGMHLYGDLVAHAAGGYEEGRFLFKDRGR